MASTSSKDNRVKVDGKFFRLNGKKFYAKGLTYGPFAPNADGEFFASRQQTRRDMELAVQAGATVLRVYYIPPRWFLDLALEMDLRVMVDVPWNKHICFLDSEENRREACEMVAEA